LHVWVRYLMKQVEDARGGGLLKKIPFQKPISARAVVSEVMASCMPSYGFLASETMDCPENWSNASPLFLSITAAIPWCCQKGLLLCRRGLLSP